VPVIVDRLTGQVRPAQIFVSVMGASNFTYAEASWTQALADWIKSVVRRAVPALTKLLKIADLAMFRRTKCEAAHCPEIFDTSHSVSLLSSWESSIRIGDPCSAVWVFSAFGVSRSCRNQPDI
jgi:hypothetical protein